MTRQPAQTGYVCVCVCVERACVRMFIMYVCGYIYIYIYNPVHKTPKSFHNPVEIPMLSSELGRRSRNGPGDLQGI